MKNEVNRALMAKTTRIYIALALLLTAGGLQARIFDKGERLYINMEAQSVKDEGGDLQYGWYSTTNNYNYAYFFKGSQNAWSTQVKQYKGTVWYVEAPAGDWEYVILTRHNSANPSWDTKITQTGNIWFYYMDGSTKKMREQNYIQNFYYDDGGDKNGANWQYVAPAPSGSPATWEYEDEQICTDAAGTQYMLQAKNYDYDNTYAHAWFKYESNTWTRLDGAEWRTSEGDKVYTVTLGGVNSDVYYFLQASRPSMCRLLRVRINQDCSEGKPGACKITSFVAVASDANVTDKTTAVNGVVAFDDKKNAGKLQIWCPNVDTVTIENENIQTPQTFKLHGLDASKAKTYTLYAKFLSGEGCDATCTVSVTPPSATPTVHTTTGTASDERLVRFTEEDVTLTPDNQTSTYFLWTNTANEDSVTTGARNHTFTAPTDAQQVTYYFLATNDPPAPEGNLITNGTFEEEQGDGNLESNYDFWGRDLTNYYDAHHDASGGYAITANANVFWHEYQPVKAHEGTHFGLFDSKIYDGTDQAAWIARTGTKNPKLKVRSGVSYLFSFWVANINAYYQMDNGARLQFQISYNGGSTWNNLGNEINLDSYIDSRWHGMSSIVTPTVSSENVALRVINQNKSSINIGNDFALDNIRFEAITASSSNIAGYESFPVTYLKCVINSATFEQRQPIGCGTTVADVDFTVNFTHPRGDLYIYEGTELLAHIPHSEIGDETTSYTGVLLNRPVDNKNHELTIYFDDGHVKTDAPTTYIYNAKNIPEISVKSLTWGTVACDVPTVTLTAVINYTNQNGSLTANVDGHPANAATYTAESDDTLQVTLVIPGITADGLDGHLLNVNFDGSHGCAIVDHVIPEAAPVVPAIEARNFRFSNPTPDCALKTTLTFDLDYTYQQGNLTYWVDDMTVQTATFTPQDRSKLTLTDLTFADIPADGKDNHVLHVSFDGPNSCVKDFALPQVPFSPVIDAVTLTAVPTLVPCDATAYEITVSFTSYFTPVPADKQIVLTYDSIGETKTTAPIALTNFPYNLIVYNIANGSHSIFAAFADAADCKTETTYDAPARETCERDSVTICEGESYWWHEAYRTGPVGENRFKDGSDSLYLFVKEKPTVTIGTIAMTCDEANEIRIPFSAVKGDPDQFDIDIVGNHFTGTLDIVGTDTAFVFSPTTMEAGDYTAHVTVGETDVPCTSMVDIHFTIALSGQMYSKWTDVLFIGNKEGRFTSYQWFADGVAMSGESLQHLYDPKGLSGSTILYHCRLTTTDGKTLYTCPQTFDDVTPSRTVDTTPNKVKATTLYDTMGRVIKGTPHNGIYIVMEELENGEIRTHKITVYE